MFEWCSFSVSDIYFFELRKCQGFVSCITKNKWKNAENKMDEKRPREKGRRQAKGKERGNEKERELKNEAKEIIAIKKKNERTEE